MRDYGKVHSTFWTSDTTRGLSDDGKTLAIYLLTGPHTNIIGGFRLPDGYAAEDLKWDNERVANGFTELFQMGFASRDEDSKWVVIHKYLKWNPIENPNQAKAAFKLFEQIPNSSSIKPMVSKGLSKYAAKFSKGFETLLEPFRNPSETLSKPFRNQEQEQKQEQKQDIPTKPAQEGIQEPAPEPEDLSEGLPRIPNGLLAAISRAYEGILVPAGWPHFSGIWSEPLKRQIRICLGENSTRAGPDFWEGHFNRIRGSDFPNSAKFSSRCFDWAIKPETVGKIENGMWQGGKPKTSTLQEDWDYIQNADDEVIDDDDDG